MSLIDIHLLELKMSLLIFLFVIFVSSNLHSNEWLEKNYDVHISCKLKESCSPSNGNCTTEFNNTKSFHFSYDTDLKSYMQYRTCTSEGNANNCYEKYSELHNIDGIWICEGIGCIKGVIMNENPNSIYAIESLALFESDTDWDFTNQTKYGKQPSYLSIIEYIFDRTRGTLIENWIDGCRRNNGSYSSCEGASLQSIGRYLSLHEKTQVNYYSCQKIDKKF